MQDAQESFRTIWLSDEDDGVVQVIDQRRLPHEFVIMDLERWQDGVEAIRDMAVRGAPLIGATAAFSVYLAARHADAPRAGLGDALQTIAAARPTAVNLRWAIDRMRAIVDTTADDELVAALRREAEAICDEDVEISLGIGRHGLALLEDIASRKDGPVNVLTHCNARDDQLGHRHGARLSRA